MDTILEHLDPQVVFVIIALLIGGGQALMELIRKRRAEWEARRGDMARRGETRSVRRAANDRTPPPLQDPFEELYEEYRRSILQDQQRAPGQSEQHPPPWQQVPPAVPPPLPVAPTPTAAQPALPPLTRPPHEAVDAAAEPWVEPAVSMTKAWQAPAAAKRAEPVLPAAEHAALAALRAGMVSRTVASVVPPSRRLATRREDWRRAVLLREVLGPPKSLS
jgi:hypothetical protein